MTLTEEERLKFIAYCAEEERSYKGLAEQAEKLPAGRTIAIPLIRKALGFAVVGQHLRSVETYTIKPSDAASHADQKEE